MPQKRAILLDPRTELPPSFELDAELADEAVKALGPAGWARRAEVLDGLKRVVCHYRVMEAPAGRKHLKRKARSRTVDHRNHIRLASDLERGASSARRLDGLAGVARVAQ